LFVHWEVPETVLRPLVPARLSLDAFEGRYYIGVVAFTMQNVRPYRWAPSVPSAREFGEINLRTYVHLEGAEPGVFFFSLDASSSLAVWAARTLWGLPYHRADICIEDERTDVSYRLQRRDGACSWSARGRVGAPLAAAGADSLSFFLCERYQFYAEHRGRLRRARVHHAPYVLHEVEQIEMESTLAHAAGLPEGGARTPDYFSPGVDVDVYALEDVR
jgi:uncharacterized protein